jgi:hypothetical protein
MAGPGAASASVGSSATRLANADATLMISKLGNGKSKAEFTIYNKRFGSFVPCSKKCGKFVVSTDSVTFDHPSETVLSGVVEWESAKKSIDGKNWNGSSESRTVVQGGVSYRLIYESCEMYNKTAPEP